MASVERDVLHVFIVDNLPHTVCSGIEDNGIGRDFDCRRGFSNLELDVLRDRSGHGKIQVGDKCFLEAHGRDFNAILADGQRWEKICAGAVRLSARRDTSSLIDRRDFGIDDRCSCGVGNRAA